VNCVTFYNNYITINLAITSIFVTNLLIKN
jgi:hypothetical protein